MVKTDVQIAFHFQQHTEFLLPLINQLFYVTGNQL